MDYFEIFGIIKIYFNSYQIFSRILFKSEIGIGQQKVTFCLLKPELKYLANFREVNLLYQKIKYKLDML